MNSLHTKCLLLTVSALQVLDASIVSEPFDVTSQFCFQTLTFVTLVVTPCQLSVVLMGKKRVSMSTPKKCVSFVKVVLTIVTSYSNPD